MNIPDIFHLNLKGGKGSEETMSIHFFCCYSKKDGFQGRLEGNIINSMKRAKFSGTVSPPPLTALFPGHFWMNESDC